MTPLLTTTFPILSCTQTLNNGSLPKIYKLTIPDKPVSSNRSTTVWALKSKTSSLLFPHLNLSVLLDRKTYLIFPFAAVNFDLLPDSILKIPISLWKEDD
ncbi:hypothetical protein OCU04_001829 [Sclerotinia nivalis]|uniref:Uncharacterized protein n=1 Tax=Sclerotinia nivalis TaxID=352851 RepID=A0A9X0AYY7_9HELO|nr:hypothetical protein OCU04_001829 [Sclerotinia nivalis]